MLSSSAATDLAPFEGDLRSTFGAAHAELPVRALQFARAAAAAAGRNESFERVLAVANLLLVQGAGPETIAAALISQAIPERDLDLEAVQAAFGTELAMLLRGLARAGRIETLNAQGVDLEQLRKMLLAIAEDVRVVLIKLAERVVYLRSLTRAEDAVRRAAGRQTLELFAPLANRLGVSTVKWELEDFSFRYTEPELYKTIAQQLDEKRNDREAYIQRVIAKLQSELTAINIPAAIEGRPKHIYSIWRKMRGKNVSFEKLYDIRAVRVIVSNIRECYTVLGVVHDLWTPVEGEFDDYIASPKSNDYRSLHTAVIGPEGRTLEVQIRTTEMPSTRARCRGALALQGGLEIRKVFDSKIAWLRQVLAWKRRCRGRCGVDAAGAAFQDTVYVLTPQDASWTSAGSTPTISPIPSTRTRAPLRGAGVGGRWCRSTTSCRMPSGSRSRRRTGGPSRDWLSAQLSRQPARAGEGAPVVP
jgi:GTP pyrophosphokinase